MTQPEPLPNGYRALCFKTIDSTNAETLRRASAGEAVGLWIQADVQTAGRGRQGRLWQSEHGNLFASLLLRPHCPLATAQQLAFVAGLAVFDTVAELTGPNITAKLMLKWPNDVLLADAKIAGILLESMSSGDKAPAVVMGIGVNISHTPQNTGKPATSLADFGLCPDVGKAFATLARATAIWHGRWDEGRGWETVRNAWIERGPRPGRLVEVSDGLGKHHGTYAGVDMDGALLLDEEDGNRKRILVGDVFLL